MGTMAIPFPRFGVKRNAEIFENCVRALLAIDPLCYFPRVQGPANTTPIPGRWDNGALPPNVQLGINTLITGDLAFKRFHATGPESLFIGDQCTMDGVHFDLGREGR